MIYKATMQNGKKRATVWFIGKSRAFSPTSHQLWTVHHQLMRLVGTYDEFSCSHIEERNPDGTLEVLCAGNCY